MVDSNLQAAPCMAMSVPAAAKTVGICRSKLYVEIAAGKLRTLKVGGRRLVRPADLNTWLESHAA